ncbi:MAG: arylsulfatase [Planctomycetaceae bacterium]|nr:MAG: arylsulfatase [Planctomycetaceae bacterium]
MPPFQILASLARQSSSALFVSAWIATQVISHCPAAHATPPNLVVILADDLGYADLSCFGGKIATPNLDRLAADGVRFTDAHSSSSVCTPTRYGLLTGRYNWRSRLQRGVLGGLSPRLIEPDRITMAEWLRRQGYHTACIGKWHLGMDWQVKPGGRVTELGIESRDQVFAVDYAAPIESGPNSVGFDHFFGISASLDMVPYAYIENDRVTEFPSEDRDFPMMLGREPGRTRQGPTAPGFDAADVLPMLAKKSVEYIDSRVAASDGDGSPQPFLLYVPLASPHTPILPTERFIGQSGINPYADFVIETDWAVGEILAAVDRHGLTDQTMFVFTSDNGCSPQADFDTLSRHGHLPSGPLRGHKADLFEGGHRIPLIVRYPGHATPGLVSDQLICLTDLFATAAEAVAGSDRVGHDEFAAGTAEDSFSFFGALRADSVPSLPRPSLVSHSINGSFAIRLGDWKLLLCPDSGGWSQPRPGSLEARELSGYQLYHLGEDLGEQNNRIEQEPELAQKLLKHLQEIIDDGRSTPGVPQMNTVTVEIR